ncbi:MAG TPA: 4-hydroxythreonine-4-phosphate dehydrogenase PdxA [Opitutaceae bacterium]|nr:4-hydroxythreonine-4-phosphate dehydrogenase PdxA [Opitutaceae bacterium]
MKNVAAGRRSPVLAITCGDPAGVGPEIVARWALARPRRLGHVALLGPESWLETLHGRCNAQLVAVGDDRFRATPGKPTVAGARVALAAMEVAAQGCIDGDFDAVVTGPVSKEWLARVSPGFVGQTEFFAERWGGEPTMVFAGGKLRMALATWHVPLSAVSRELTPERLSRAVRRADWLCRAEDIERPRIAVCGINPHAGEHGLLGDEEDRWMNGCLRRLRRRVPGVSDALPGDTVFVRALKGEFDATVAAYHDQGLAPLKAVDFDRSVNITLGLPFIRTSPDHGTAFGIAGQGRANVGSFAAAIRMAERLARAQRRLGPPE